jgi:hypothetical protein
MNWRKQLALNPELREVSAWPLPSTVGLKVEHRHRFQSRLELMTAVLELGISPEEASQQFGISKRHIYYLLERSLAASPEEAPPLAFGLLPYRHRTAYRRKKNARDTKGLSGALAQLFDTHPHVKQHLDELVRRGISKGRDAINLSPGALHKSFLNFLRAEGFEDDEYPFNTEEQARESIRQYWHERSREFHAERALKKNYASAVDRSRSSGVLLPMEHLQIDEHLLDAKLRLSITHPGGWQSVIELPRFWLVGVADVSSTAWVGYAFGYVRQISQESILEALSTVNARWQPKALKTPNLRYPVGAGLPAGLMADYVDVAPLLISMDNAWTHHSNAVRRAVHERWHAGIEYGRPAQPTARSLIENLFGRLETSVHRLPDTTGSYPKDPKRKRSHRLPTIPVEHFEELIDVTIASYNGTPRGDLGGKSPLGVLDDARSGIGVFRRLASADRCRKSFHERQFRIRVQGNLERGIRSNVNLFYARYKGPALDRTPSLIGRHVLAYCDIRDARTLRLETLEGVQLGDVQVSGRWAAYAHSLSMRCQMVRFAKRQRISSADPLQEYLDHLTQNADKPPVALELLKLYKAAGHQLQPSSDQEKFTRSTTSQAADALDQLIAEKTANWSKS